MNSLNTEMLELSSNDKRSFFNSLLVLYKSGIPLIDSMSKIEKRSNSAKVKYLSKCIANDLTKGKEFAKVISKYEKSFGKVIAGLLISGDEAGELTNVLARIQMLLKKEDSLKQKAISALTYPALVFTILIFVTCLFTFFVNPMLAGRGEANMVALAIGTLIKTSIVFAILIAIIVHFIKNKVFEKSILPFCLNLPLVGNILRDFYFSNFFLVLMIGYESGLSATKSLDLATDTLKLNLERERLHRASRLILNGKDLSSALMETEALPENYISVISTGETTGEMDKALQDIITEIDERIDTAISVFGKLIEPAILIIAGIAVGILMYNYYSNMYKNLF